jgi:hypothetical protein
MEPAILKRIRLTASRLAYALEADISLGVPVSRLLRDSQAVLEIGPGPPGRSWRRFLGSARLSQGLAVERYADYTIPQPTPDSWGTLIVGTATHLPFHDDSFDASVALDVIEHLTKDGGLQMIKEMKRVSKKVVIVMTPNGFLPQEADENPWQRHLSGWSTREFRDLGFNVRGIRGFRFLRGERAKPVISPLALGVGISMASTPFASLKPEWSFQLLAWYSRPEDPGDLRSRHSSHSSSRSYRRSRSARRR